MDKDIKNFYLVDDLKNVLNIYPCSTETGYISYTKEYLIELIRRDFTGEKLFLKRNVWNNEEPAIYGLGKTTPYSEEAKAFAKSHKTHGGGRNLIVMNEAYFSNARYVIETKYWDLQRDTFKRDTRKSIRNAVSNPVITGNETELRHVVEKFQNAFYAKVNKEIASINKFFEIKSSQFFFYLSFYKNSFVQQHIGNPTELLCELDNQMDVMKNGFQPLSVDHKQQEKFIDNILSLLSEKNLSNIERENLIVERIYNREERLIQQLRETYDKFGKIKLKIYQLEEAIKAETAKRIRANKEICPGSFIIHCAQNNGLIGISFDLSDK